ncbi:MAG TPA: hypothetical protein DDY35_05490 [Acidimicrobiaceae bacterium]|nr:hypothetical protein [Acidimicrobiaceae bacterium]HBH75898.1 hypothetical protein [Acidimicrobiaceae bacterium]|tara:strand:- start:254 stop:466 length:213 start_codon:yes stop_codon:yes gene_type:complete
MADENPKITRDDLEAGFRELSNEVQGQVDEAKSKLLPAAVGGGLLLLFVAYVIGKRVGATKSTIVEIRRI